MKKLLTQTLTAAMALTVVSTAVATPLARKAAANASRSTSVVEALAGARSTGKTRIQVPGVRKASGRQFAKTHKATGSTKAPMKQRREGTTPLSAYGSLVYSAVEDAQVGVYNIPLNTAGEPTLTQAMEASTTSAWYADGKYYHYANMEFWGFYLGTIVDVYDAQTFELIEETEPEVGYYTFFDPKQNPVDGQVYTCGTDGESLLWGTVDLYTSQFNTIANIEYSLPGFVIKNGEGYGITNEGTILKIELATGASTVIGETGITNTYLTSAYYDAASDKMYYANNTDEECAMWAIDLNTCEAQKIYDFANGEEFVGLFTPKTLAAGTPAAPTEVSIVGNGGSLNYTVNVTAPTECADGTALSADGLTYKVFTSGQTYTGSIAPGQTVSVSATATAAGFTSARAVLVNAAGESFGQGASAFVGADDITPVSNVKLVSNGAGMFTLSWNAPEPVHNGYFDASQLSYTVTDMISGNTVQSGLTATSLEIPYTAPTQLTAYQYSVTATYNGETYAPVASNALSLGSMTPPFSATFDDASELGFFNIIDTNSDGKSWTYNADKGCVTVSYNSSMDMDDWLVLPALNLEAGKAYKFQFDAAAGSTSYAERVEVKMGNACTPEAMTTAVVAPTDLTTKEYTTLSGSISVPTTGVYYIGIHGISDADKLKLYVDNVQVSAALDGNAPAVATGLTATAATDGSLVATINFTAPTLNIGGQPVGELTSATVTRADGSVVETVNAPVAGQTYTVTDNAATNGNNTYSVVVTNAAGQSEAATVTVFVGFTVPAELAEVTVTETAPGQVTLNWAPVSKDANGLDLPAGTVTYAVYTYDYTGRQVVAQNLTETTYSYTAVTEGQEFMQWAVFPVSTLGEGSGALSDMIAVGTPYATPVRESFADQALAYNWMLASPNPDGEMDVNIGTDSSFEGITSQDADNGFIYFQGSYLDDAAALISGKIAIPTGTATQLSFYNLGITADAGNEVNVSVVCDGTTTDLGTTVSYGDFEWKPVRYDLSAYAGKTVQLVFTVKVTALKYTMLDNIVVGTPLADDLVALKLEAPAKVQAGNDVNVVAVVENRGTEAAASYSVDFYMNNELLSTVQGSELASGAKANAQVTVVTTPLTADELSFYAVVNYAGDEDTANNTSASTKTAVVKSDVPAPTGLTASLVNGKVELLWDACNSVAGSSEVATESFENGNAGDMTYEGWTFVDLDQSAVGGMQNLDIPGITPGTTLASFFVWDATSGMAKVTAHSGVKCLAAMFRYDDGATNDWMISPDLSGNEQTVSFWAMSYSNSYPEKMEVYYTTGESTDPADFTKVTAFGTKTMAATWTEYSFQVPAGATRFALRSCATGSFLLLVDDVTYERGSAPVTLNGYNVYCNGTKVNEVAVAESAYQHAPDANGEVTYNVTAVYDRGESRPSNAASVDFSGLDKLTAGVSVVAVNNEIVVRGAAGANITVIAADGKQVAARQGVDAARIKVTNGVYLVTVGQRTVKVAVK